MLSENQIKNYLDNYKVINGKVYSKSNNEEILDEDLIIDVKVSYLVYLEAKASYEDGLAHCHDKDNYTSTISKEINKALIKLSINGQRTTNGYNKLINGIVDGNGHYEEDIPGSNLSELKFNLLIEPKLDYTIALLKKKFRERGLDINGIKIQQDMSEIKTGVSKVIIDYNLVKYEKNKDKDNKKVNHPKKDILDKLDADMQHSKSIGDEVAYNYAKENMKKIIQENRYKISLEELNKMSMEDKKTFFQIKMKEAKILNDKDEFNYWKSCLDNLTKENVIETKLDLNINFNRNNNIEYYNFENNNLTSNYYEDMINSIKKLRNTNITDEEKKKLIGNVFYNEGYLIKDIKSEEDIAQLLTKLTKDLENNEFENKLLNGIIEELQSKINKKNNVTNEDIKKEITNTSSDFDNLKYEMNKLLKQYQIMNQDNVIDDIELAILIRRMKDLTDDAYKLRTSNPSHKEIINSIIVILEEETAKMNQKKNAIEEISNNKSL